MALTLLHEPRTRLGQVGRHADLEPGRLARARVEDVQVSRLLVDHLARAGRGALDREVARDSVRRTTFFGRGVVRVEVELAVAIGEEVDRLADPHGLGVVAAAGGLGDLLVREVGELEHPDPRGRAAPIVLPLAEPLAQRRVGQELPVGRDRPHVAAGDRQRLRARPRRRRR